MIELKIEFPDDIAARLNTLSETQIHDAYDADRDGVFVRCSAEFKNSDEIRTVPGFAMREAPGGPWKWRVRFSPRRAGAYQVRVHVEAGFGKAQPSLSIDSTQEEFASVARQGLAGPLVMPGEKESPELMRQLQADGKSRATWLFGACRAWVSEVQDPNNDWSPHEWLDRESELFVPMRENGYNLLNQWMAPWEFLLVHHDRAEYWKKKPADRQFQRVPLPGDAAWSPYQCFDQGRAAAFDELVRQCEGDEKRVPIYLLLSPLPHQCLQVKEHPWGSQESGWSPANDAGKQSLERLDGFSAFVPAGEHAPKQLSVWNFFEADPATPLDDWRSRLFDHQANFYRYLIARWGYSRALGIWVLIDELDAIGDVVGSRRNKTGWWGHPACELWLANMIRMFRGQLSRADGLQYAGDPFGHPLHAATTSSGGQAGRGGNIDWEGGPANARPDLFGFHWYPSWPEGEDWTHIWSYTIAGVANYSTARIGAHPRLISEFGAPDREKPGDAPSPLYPTLYHHAIWAAIFSGQSGTPMDWDDGKQFGELTWRKRPGAFDQAHYPIDNASQLGVLRKFLEPLCCDHLHPCGNSPKAPGIFVRDDSLVFVLYDDQSPALHGWGFSPDGAMKINLKGMAAGNYLLTWFDPWTAAPVTGVPAQRCVIKDDGTLDLDGAPALKVLSAAAMEFPKNTRLARGQDVAFRLIIAP